MKIVRIISLLVVIIATSVVVKSTATGPSVQPKYLSNLTFNECRRDRDIECPELALQALQGFRRLVSRVGPRDMHAFITTNDVLDASNIRMGSSLSQRDYECVRDEVRRILRIVYVTKDVYDILVKWNQSSVGGGYVEAAFRTFWKYEVKMRRHMVTNLTNMCSAILWYTNVFEPLVGRPLSETAVGGSDNHPHFRGYQVTVVVPPREGVLGMIKRKCEILEVGGGKEYLVSSKKRVLESYQLFSQRDPADGSPRSKSLRREPEAPQQLEIVVASELERNNDEDSLFASLGWIFESDPSETTVVAQESGTLNPTAATAHGDKATTDDIDDFLNLYSDADLADMFGTPTEEV